MNSDPAQELIQQIFLTGIKWLIPAAILAGLIRWAITTAERKTLDWAERNSRSARAKRKLKKKV